VTGRWRWPAVTGVALAGAGLLISLYLSYEHLTTNATLSCPDTGAINCQRVTTSSESVILGVPVAYIGVAYFAAMVGLCWPGMDRFATLRLGAAAAGVAFVLYLIYAELFRVNAICLWCTAVHVLAVALFATLAFAAALTPGSPRQRSAGARR
jgi:uncharacterized membrane protein